LHEDQEEEERLAFTKDDIELCRLMVIVQNDKVLLLHKSVKDFLVSSDNGHFIHELSAHANFAYRCIDYLLEHPYDKWEQNNTTSDDRFLLYSAEFWVEHAHLAGPEFAIKDRHAEFFNPNSISWGWLPSYNLRVDKYRGIRIPNRFSVFHIAARWGIVPLVNHTLIRGHLMVSEESRASNERWEFIDAKFLTSEGMTPLAEAASSGHVAVLSLLLNRGRKNMRILDCVTEAAARNERNGKEVMALLLDQRGDQITITEEVVKAAAWNRGSGKEIMALLLDRREDQIPITEEVVKVASWNRGSGKEIMALLLSRRGAEGAVRYIAKYFDAEIMALLLGRHGGQIPITEEVVKAAAGNKMDGKEVMELLLDRWGDQIPITEGMVKSIAQHFGAKMLALLLNRQGDKIPITTEVVEIAAGSWRDGNEMMALLLDRRGEQISITQEVVTAAAGNEWGGKEVITLLLNRRGDQIPITKEVFKAAAGNWRNGKEVIALLLDRPGDQVRITEEMVKSIARYFDAGIMALPLNRRGGQIQITEEVVKSIAQHFDARIMALLLDQQRDQNHQIPITEEVVKAAAGNEINGKAVMAFLFDRRGDRIPITEKVVKAAARNWRSGKEVMELLFDRRGDQIPITEEVVKAAVGNERQGKQLITLLDQMTNLCLSQEVIDTAAASGQEKVLFYFKEQLGVEISSISFSIARFYNAAKTGDEIGIRDLLADNIPADTKNIQGRSPLWQAACGGHQQVVKLLLETPNIDVDARGENGCSALFCAVKDGYLGIVKLLLTSGANPTLPDKHGNTPFSIARGKCKTEFLRRQNHHNVMEHDLPDIECPRYFKPHLLNSSYNDSSKDGRTGGRLFCSEGLCSPCLSASWRHQGHLIPMLSDNTVCSEIETGGEGERF
jgi:ankyrin repeat protein